MKSFGLFSKPTTKPYRATNGITVAELRAELAKP